MSWPSRRRTEDLKLPPVREHQARIAQHFHLNRVVLGQPIAYGWDDCRRKTAVVKRHFVLVLAHVAIHDTRSDFDEQAGIVQQIVELLAYVDKSRGLTKRIAEKRHAAKTVARYLLIHCHQHDGFVLRVVVPVVGVG